jgi:hypothetical protein
LPSLEDDLLGDIQVLNRAVWRSSVDARVIDEWLKGFGQDGLPGSKGRLHGLYLLSRFLYYGDAEIRALLRALFRDHFRYPIIAAIRELAGHTRDEGFLNTAFALALDRTRFLGIGNPSESGTHLLYFYRQENMLKRDLFVNWHDVFDLSQPTDTLSNPSITRYVFIDDFCGSGHQAEEYAAIQIPKMRNAAKQAGLSIRIEYHVLVALQTGLASVRGTNAFDDVRAVVELDETFRAFGTTSRYFENAPNGIDRQYAESLATLLGLRLVPDDPLGYDDGQLLLGFVHNTPDNTLPIFWHPGQKQSPWSPVFRRYPKLTP